MTHRIPARRIASKRRTVVRIRPSKYDDEGYVIRHFRGVLPSNTLACPYGLTEDLKRRSTLGQKLEIKIRLLDDTVQPIPVDRIIRSNKVPRNRTVVALVGVQSNLAWWFSRPCFDGYEQMPTIRDLIASAVEINKVLEARYCSASSNPQLAHRILRLKGKQTLSHSLSPHLRAKQRGHCGERDDVYCA